MKNVSILVIILAFVWACGNTEQSESTKSIENNEEIVMYEDSELAVLMRGIHENAKIWRDSLVNGSVVLDSIEIYSALTQSVPTDSGVVGPLYNGLAQNYQIALNDFLSAEDIQLAKKSYNNLVSACLSCHGEFCPGPMKTIRKLKVAEN
jgi:hypothetical protein